MKKSRRRYLQYLNPIELLQTKKVLKSNPTLPAVKPGSRETVISLFGYSAESCKVRTGLLPDEVGPALFESGKQYWLNLDIPDPQTVEAVGKKIGLHPLLVEDILSVHQRPKVEEINDSFACVLQMLYFNSETQTIEGEQVSFVLGPNYLISFQDDAHRDLFDPIRERLQREGTKVRGESGDYLLYALLDSIVDHYFTVLDRLAELIEKLEEELVANREDDYTMNRINNMRKELIFFRRNTTPVRDLLGNILRSDHRYFQSRNRKYFNDIYDHIVQVNELTESHRDVLTNIRDLYLSQMNLKLNEVMKFLAIVTTLLAPATVIGGIFGMNFDRIPYLHHQDGFWIATVLMIAAPLLMLIYFRRKGWF
jgi:magnesium transporter